MESNGEGPVVTDSPDHLQAINNGIEEKTVIKTSEPEPKSAHVSVIQTAPPRLNGVAEQVPEEGEKEVLSIQPPTEQLPAELLDQEEQDGAASLTTVASLVEQEEKEEAAATTEPTQPPPPAATASPVKTPKSAAELSAEWEDDKDEEEEAKTAEEAAAATEEQQPEAEEQPDMAVAAATKTEEEVKTEQSEASESAGAAPTPRKSGRQPKPSTKKVESEEMEESVDAIAKELERTSGGGGGTTDGAAVEASPRSKKTTKSPKAGKAPAETEEGGQEDSPGAEGKGGAKRKGRPKKKDLDEKVEHVTKLGNNMYFYTGPGGQDSPPPLQSDDEDMDVSDDVRIKKEKEAAADAASRKSSRPGKGRNPRLERDDEEVEIPKKTPIKPNLNPGWLKEAAKSMTPKSTPGKGSSAPRSKRCGKCEACHADNCGECDNCKDMIKFGGPNKKRKPCVRRMCKNIEEVVKSPEVAAATPKAAKAKAVTSAAASSVEAAGSPAPEASPPRDEELPEFDPAQFTPGYVPKTIKKGDDEYLIVVQGVQNTGLCGKYWGDLDNLPPRRKSKAPESFKPGTSPEPGAQGRRGSVGSTGSADTPPGKRGPKKQDAPSASKSAAKKQITKPEKASNPQAGGESSAEESGAEGQPAGAGEEEQQQTSSQQGEDTPLSQPKKRGRKRKVLDTPDAGEEKKARTEAEEGEGAAAPGVHADQEPPKEGTPKKKAAAPAAAKSSPDRPVSVPTPRNVAAVSKALSVGAPAGQQRSVSCVADTSTQKEVVVECFAPYDDHRWVNIGKERDGMTPDAVQYARALRPPYHLLSFLRIKGHSTKGMSCTDKNTMVFVVLEGEITVILHTTQFNAKKGDSFYIPPKNYYNLINQKAREAELSLIQFQYDGPLPTVNPAQTQQ